MVIDWPGSLGGGSLGTTCTRFYKHCHRNSIEQPTSHQMSLSNYLPIFIITSVFPLNELHTSEEFSYWRQINDLPLDGYAGRTTPSTS